MQIPNNIHAHGWERFSSPRCSAAGPPVIEEPPAGRCARRSMPLATRCRSRVRTAQEEAPAHGAARREVDAHVARREGGRGGGLRPKVERARGARAMVGDRPRPDHHLESPGFFSYRGYSRFPAAGAQSEPIEYSYISEIELANCEFPLRQRIESISISAHPNICVRKFSRAYCQPTPTVVLRVL